ncbi:hypothetical protein CFP56_012337, partial [Quercus suber]
FYEIVTSSCPPHWYGDLERDSHLFAVHFPALTASVVRLTGAGDCLVGRTLASLSATVDVALCFCYGGLLSLQLGFVVSVAIDIGISSKNLMLDFRLMGYYLTAFERFYQSMSSTLGTLLCFGAMVLVYFRALVYIIFLELWGSPLRSKFCIVSGFSSKFCIVSGFCSNFCVASGFVSVTPLTITFVLHLIMHLGAHIEPFTSAMQNFFFFIKLVENDRVRNGNREALTALRKRARTTKTSVASPFESIMRDIGGPESRPLVKEVCTTCGNHDSNERTWMMFPGTDLIGRIPFHAAHTILETDQAQLDFDAKRLQSYMKEKSFLISERGAIADRISPGVLKSIITLSDKPK